MYRIVHQTRCMTLDIQNNPYNVGYVYYILFKKIKLKSELKLNKIQDFFVTYV